MRRAAKRRRDRRLFSAATLPYRKDDVTAIDDSLRHPYFASHGYASVRVDIRGSGNSDGVLTDEYSLQEQDDALEVIDWIAAQPWCTGSLGMMGISWGGFNSLQVAARRPPQLKAIISACSTDDRYADDVHYMGGCLLGYYMLPWASVMLAFNARPPDHLAVGERWRALWLERLEANRLLVDRGSSTSDVTPTGDMGPSARTTRRSSARSTSSAAGPTPTRTRSSGCSRASSALAKRSSGRGLTSGRSKACPAPRSGSSRKRSAGGTTG